MSSGDPEVLLIDYEPSSDDFLVEVLAGLRQPCKRLPCKYFYDQRGCELFDQICELDEYYPTRTELGIMQRWVGDVAEMIGPGCMLIEYGSGASVKTRMLLDELPDVAAYVPVDIARDYLRQAAAHLAVEYPELEVLPVCADFHTTITVPRCAARVQRRVAYFPGSTIGNFEPDEALGLLENMAAVCGPGGGLLIGVDLDKDPTTLEAAYNDRQGVTAEFNRNLLRRINCELGGDFDLQAFRHHAFYDRRAGRIEMHLVSQAKQTVTLDGEQFSIAEGERICTEYSHKYRLDEFAELAAAAGFSACQHWTDSQRMFALLFCTLD